MKLPFVSLILSAGMMYAAHWGYGEHNGPEMWAKLDPKFAICSTGMHQSPINIQASKTTEAKNELHILHGTNAKDIVNNGHTVQVSFSEAGGVVFKNKRYLLVQLHFHTPSETQIEGKSYPMEMHLVHKSDAGELLVLAVLFEQGETNVALNNILTYAPNDVNKNYPMDMVSISQMLPKTKGYYAFSGSLTTPACSEGVQWVVLKESISASKSQIETLNAIMKENARGVQPLNNRVILSAP